LVLLLCPFPAGGAEGSTTRTTPAVFPPRCRQSVLWTHASVFICHRVEKSPTHGIP
jgi:hypothetical protein